MTRTYSHDQHIFSSLKQYLVAVAQRCSAKKVFLGISQNSQENTCARVSFKMKLQPFVMPQKAFNAFIKAFEVPQRACNFIKKETLARLFSCEFCEISKNTFFYRTPLLTASKY